VNQQIFKDRTKQIALRVVRLVQSLPRNRVADKIGDQLIKSGTSIGANYRAACRGRSPADVIAKLKIVEEEADETIYWMEILCEANIIKARRLVSLMSEVEEILAMVVASIKTLRKRSLSART
jgi:four helix bundle protein